MEQSKLYQKRINGEVIKRPLENRECEFLNELKVYDHLSKSQCKYIVKRIDSCEKELFLKMEYCESTLRMFFYFLLSAFLLTNFYL